MSWQVVALFGLAVFAWALKEVLKAIPNTDALASLKKAVDDAQVARDLATKLTDRITALEMTVRR